MAKVLWFIGLKIIEIATVVFGPYYLGMWVHTWSGNWLCMHNAEPTVCVPYWIIGFLSLLMVVASAMIMGLIAYFNWQWARMLHEKFKK